MPTVKVDDQDDRVGRILADPHRYFTDARLRAHQQVDAETNDTLMQTANWQDSMFQRFGIPAVAAAAVVAVAIGGYALLGGNNSRNGFVPAGTTTRTLEPTRTPHKTQPQNPEQTPHTKETKPDPPAAVSKPIGKPGPAYRSCINLVQEAEAFAGGSIRGLTGKLAVDNGKGVTVVLANRTDAYTCNIKPDSAVSYPRPLDSAVSPETFAVVADMITPHDPSEMVWGGGALPNGVTSVIYTFPDGHRESALTRDGFWGMQYFSPEWFLGESQSQTAFDPIKVTLNGPRGRRELTLKWGVHTCNQVSHGC